MNKEKEYMTERNNSTVPTAESVGERYGNIMKKMTRNDRPIQMRDLNDIQAMLVADDFTVIKSCPDLLVVQKNETIYEITKNREVKGVFNVSNQYELNPICVNAHGELVSIRAALKHLHEDMEYTVNPIRNRDDGKVSTGDCPISLHELKLLEGIGV